MFAAEGGGAIEDDAAEAIVLGCAGLTDLVGPLTDALGVPVIDGVLAAVTMAEGLLAQGLTTSRREHVRGARATAGRTAEREHARSATCSSTAPMRRTASSGPTDVLVERPA